MKYVLVVFGLMLTSSIPNSRAQTNNSGKVLTFNQDVAPIVFAKCSGCHRPGQSGPFSLLTHADLKKRSKQIGDVVARKYMPPWLPEHGHGEFVGDRSLSEAQIKTIEDWIAEGAPEGSGSPQPKPAWKAGWQLGTPDLVVQMPYNYSLSAAGKDVYRNFVFPIPLSDRKFVRGVEFLPGNWKVVHHAFINIDPTPFSRRLAQKQNPPGFDGMLLPETARMPGGQFMSWQPGKVASFAPDGLAWALDKNTDIVLQMHMHPTGKPEPVRPMIGFYFTEQPPTNMAFRVNLNPLLIDIPAGNSNYVVEDNYTVPVDVDVLAVNPHAHYLAKRMEGWANLPDGSRKDLLLIKDWDFNWQGDYRYASPVALPKGSTIAMRFTYDNSSANIRNPSQPPKRVKYGLQTTDEMAELWFQVLAHNAADRNSLAQDFYVHLARSALSYNEQASKDNPNDAESHTRAGRALVFFNQFPEAMQHYQAAVKANPNYDRAWYKLGYINFRMNRLPEEKQAFDKVVKLNPDDFEAQGSLGYICMQKGDLTNAEAHFKAALQINPADDIARGNLEQIQKTKAANPAAGSK